MIIQTAHGYGKSRTFGQIRLNAAMDVTPYRAVVAPLSGAVRIHCHPWAARPLDAGPRLWKVTPCSGECHAQRADRHEAADEIAR